MSKSTPSFLCAIALTGLLVLALVGCQGGPPPAGMPGESGGPATAKPTTAGTTPSSGGPVEKSPEEYATRIPLKVDEKSLIKQGEAATICGVTLAVDGFQRQVGKGSGDKDIMLVSISLASGAQKEAAIIPYDFYLSDMAGKTVQLSYTAVVTRPLDGGALKPGRTMTGDVAYDVPGDKKDFRVLWMPGWCADKAVVQLNEQ